MPVVPFVLLIIFEYLIFSSLKPETDIIASVYLTIAIIVLSATLVATCYFGFWLGMIVPAIESGQCGQLCFLGQYVKP